MTSQSTSPNPSSHFIRQISFGIRSYTVSKTYYTALFAPFGISLVYSNKTSSPRILGFGPNTSPEDELLTLFEKGDEVRVPGPETQITFIASGRKTVREFGEAGVRNVGRDEIVQGVRTEVVERYYTTFCVGSGC